MKPALPFLSVALLALASCTTAYKTGQTPDDVYYSAARQRDEYVRVEERDDRRYRDDRSEEEIREDRMLRMRTMDRRFQLLDDVDCYCYTGPNYYRYQDYHRFNNQFAFRNDPWYWNRWNGWNSWNTWNNPAVIYNPYFNNPYFNGVVVGNRRPVYNRPRRGNMYTYDNNGSLPKSNSRTFSGSSGTENNYRGSGTNAGGFLRNVFGGSNSNNASSGTSNSGSSSAGKAPSGNSSSGSSGGSRPAPVRKF